MGSQVLDFVPNKNPPADFDEFFKRGGGSFSIQKNSATSFGNVCHKIFLEMMPAKFHRKGGWHFRSIKIISVYFWCIFKGIFLKNMPDNFQKGGRGSLKIKDSGRFFFWHKYS